MLVARLTQAMGIPYFGIQVIDTRAVMEHGATTHVDNNVQCDPTAESVLGKRHPKAGNRNSVGVSEVDLAVVVLHFFGSMEGTSCLAPWPSATFTDT
jgi:hypothetical protein